MAVKQLPKISDLPEPPDRLVGDQERFDVLTFNSLKAQKKMVNDDLNKTLIPALNEFAVDVNASVDAAALSERNAHDSEEVAKRKAGEASGSAGAAKVSEDNAKVSETNALASKNAAALSAESAESARIAAEAARDEAQDLANVGYAAENHAGLAKVDGKTTQADAGGVITAKDVAIGGDLGDLASARGQIGAARELGNNVDYNTVTEAGFYLINATGGVNGPIVGSAAFLQVFYSKKDAFTKNLYQIVYAYSSARERMFLRQYRLESNDWSSWSEIVSSSRIGDGFTVNNGIISVPEYEGATASTAGTSGLVPPATAGQQESFLTGGGEYKPVKSMPSGAVIPFAKVNLGGPANRNPIFWGQSEPDTGWLICDGGSDGRGGSVPNLREKFIMCANGVNDAGQTGGATSATPTISVNNASTGVKTQGTTLTISTIANHAHRLNLQQYKYGNEIANYGFDSSLPTVTPLGDRIENTGDSNSHAHGVTDPTHTHTATASKISITPPFYKLVYCIKLPES